MAKAEEGVYVCGMGELGEIWGYVASLAGIHILHYAPSNIKWPFENCHEGQWCSFQIRHSHVNY